MAVRRAFGVDVGERLDIDKLRQWSSDHLDTRAGRERHEAAAEAFSEGQIRALNQAAPALGLTTTALPVHRLYGLAVILGGTVTGNEVRAAYTFDLLKKGWGFSRLVAAAGYRPLTDAEQALATEQAVPAAAAADEYNHLAWVICRHLDADRRLVVAGDGPTDAFTSWSIEELARDGTTVAYLVRPPSRRAHRRADSLDAVTFTRQQLAAEPTPTLVITSAIYTPYTFFLLAPHASEQAPIEVVGTPTGRSDQPGRQAQRFAQEIHATLSVLPT